MKCCFEYEGKKYFNINKTFSWVSDNSPFIILPHLYSGIESHIEYVMCGMSSSSFSIFYFLSACSFSFLKHFYLCWILHCVVEALIISKEIVKKPPLTSCGCFSPSGYIQTCSSSSHASWEVSKSIIFVCHFLVACLSGVIKEKGLICWQLNFRNIY